MTEDEWLNCRDCVKQNGFLFTKGRSRRLQLFLCACCRRALDIVSDSQRRRVSRAAKYFKPQPGVVLGDVWKVCRRTVEITEQFADGLATEDVCRDAGTAADRISFHYEDIAAGANYDDANYDEAAVKMGCDMASAAECAASIIATGAELSVRVVANFVAFDSDAYYAGAHGDPDFDQDHPHLRARYSERAE